MTFSDRYHLDTCAGRYCNAMRLRSDMRRIPGKRGWFCPTCYARLTGGPTQGVLDLRPDA